MSVFVFVCLVSACFSVLISVHAILGSVSSEAVPPMILRIEVETMGSNLPPNVGALPASVYSAYGRLHACTA